MLRCCLVSLPPHSFTGTACNCLERKERLWHLVLFPNVFSCSLKPLRTVSSSIVFRLVLGLRRVLPFNKRESLQDRKELPTSHEWFEGVSSTSFFLPKTESFLHFLFVFFSKDLFPLPLRGRDGGPHFSALFHRPFDAVDHRTR